MLLPWCQCYLWRQHPIVPLNVNTVKAIFKFPFLTSNSSHWYTSQPLEATTLQSMLTRILAVKECHQEQKAAQRQSSATAENSLQWYGALLIHILQVIFSATETFSDTRSLQRHYNYTFSHQWFRLKMGRGDRITRHNARTLWDKFEDLSKCVIIVFSYLSGHPLSTLMHKEFSNIRYSEISMSHKSDTYSHHSSHVAGLIIVHNKPFRFTLISETDLLQY